MDDTGCSPLTGLAEQIASRGLPIAAQAWEPADAPLCSFGEDNGFSFAAVLVHATEDRQTWLCAPLAAEQCAAFAESRADWPCVFACARGGMLLRVDCTPGRSAPLRVAPLPVALVPEAWLPACD